MHWEESVARRFSKRYSHPREIYDDHFACLIQEDSLASSSLIGNQRPDLDAEMASNAIWHLYNLACVDLAKNWICALYYEAQNKYDFSIFLPHAKVSQNSYYLHESLFKVIEVYSSNPSLVYAVILEKEWQVLKLILLLWVLQSQKLNFS